MGNAPAAASGSRWPGAFQRGERGWEGPHQRTHVVVAIQQIRDAGDARDVVLEEQSVGAVNDGLAFAARVPRDRRARRDVVAVGRERERARIAARRYR